MTPSALAPYALAALLTATPAARAQDAALWKAHVEPILARHCVRCHGDTRRKAELDLRTLESALAGSESGPVIVPGDLAASRLHAVLQPGADPRMPPGQAPPLAHDEVALIARWIAGEKGDWEPPPHAVQDARAPALPAGISPSLVVDLCIERGWVERGATPSAPCDDRTFARRVHLDLIGRIPTIAELDAFIARTESNKRERLVDELLATEEHARHLADVFDVVLIGRDGRQDAAWRAYLERAFRDNRPWSDIARDLLVARPDDGADDGTDGEAWRGAAWFLYSRRNNHQSMAEAVAPALFGVRVACAQCHDHPLAPEIEQRHYWALVSFFNRTKNVDTKRGPALAESAVGGFISFSTLQGESIDAELVFLNGKRVDEARPPAGAKEEDTPDKYRVAPETNDAAAVPLFSRREKLFEVAVSDDERFDRAAVNRIWALIMGRGLVHPVDTMDSAHPPSHPELLRWLAADFRRTGHDMRRLIRSLVLTRAYALDSRPARDTLPAQPDAFARALEKPLAAEALLRSALVATRGATALTGEGDGEAQARKEFAEAFPELFVEDYSATLKQALFVTNGARVDALLEPTESGLTRRLLELSDDVAVVREAFLAVLGREPDDEESARGASYLAERAVRRQAGVEQLVWALLASAEFRFNH